jgi:hypothetical protein
MTVRELIDLLATFPQDADVVFPDLSGVHSPYYFELEDGYVAKAIMAVEVAGRFNPHGSDNRTVTVRIG